MLDAVLLPLLLLLYAFISFSVEIPIMLDSAASKIMISGDSLVVRMRGVGVVVGAA